MAHLTLKDGSVVGQNEGRLDLMTAWMQEHPELFEGRRVLDLGSNCGHFPIIMAQLGADVSAVEPRPGMCAVFRALLENTEHKGIVVIHQEDLRHVDFRGLRCDILSCLGLIYHLEEPWKVMGRILDQLHPSVWLVESQLFDMTHRAMEGGHTTNSTLAWEPGPVLQPSAEEVERGIRSCGYEPERVDLGKDYHSDNGEARGLWIARRVFT